jgi:hypothetical protein
MFLKEFPRATFGDLVNLGGRLECLAHIIPCKHDCSALQNGMFEGEGNWTLFCGPFQPAFKTIGKHWFQNDAENKIVNDKAT